MKDQKEVEDPEGVLPAEEEVAPSVEGTLEVQKTVKNLTEASKNFLREEVETEDQNEVAVETDVTSR